MEWYVTYSGQRIGPISASEVVQKVVSGVLEDSALVWKQGMQDWQPLSAYFKRPAIDPVDVPSVAAPSVGGRQLPPLSGRRTNFFSKFWRGEYSLPISFWIVGFFGNLLVLLGIGIARFLLQGADFDPYLIFASLGGSWLSVGIWALFQSVGTWRSARRYSAERATKGRINVWAVLAQLLIVCGLVGLLSELAQTGAPQLAATWRIAFQNDPDTPDFTLRVMRNGTELEIAGGLKYGLASDAERIMRASPHVKVVHLNSNGGRIGEAEKLARLIRQRGLITYTSQQCASACTIAFAAGRERWLKRGAQLGYHTSSFAGEEHANVMRSSLLGAALPPSFVERAVSYSPKQMWYPTEAELLAAGAISGTADAYRFAASGYGVRPGLENFKASLREVALFQALEEAEPDIFAKFATRFQNAYMAGTPEGLIVDELRDSYMGPLVTSRMARADDRLSAEFAALLADEYEWLGEKSPRSCYEFAAKGANATLIESLSPELRKRELGLTERLLRSAPVLKPITSVQLDQFYAVLFRKLSGRYAADDLKLIDSPDNVKPPKFGLYCQISTAMFREISRMPSTEAGYLMRDIFTETTANRSK